MLRYILIGIAVYLLFRTARRLIVFRRYKQDGSRKDSVNEMVKCVNCDTFISKNSAVYQLSGWRCADDCSTEDH